MTFLIELMMMIILIGGQSHAKVKNINFTMIDNFSISQKIDIVCK